MQPTWILSLAPNMARNDPRVQSRRERRVKRRRRKRQRGRRRGGGEKAAALWFRTETSLVGR